MNLFEKIKTLPELQRKTIFWVIVILVIVICFFFWTNKAKRLLENFKKENLFDEITSPSLPELEVSEKEELEQQIKDLEELRKSIEEELEEMGQSDASGEKTEE